MDGCDSKATRCATCPRACTWLLCLTSQVTAPQIGGAHTAFLTQGPWLDGGSTYRHLELQAVAPFPGLAQLTCPGPAQQTTPSTPSSRLSPGRLPPGPHAPLTPVAPGGRPHPAPQTCVCSQLGRLPGVVPTPLGSRPARTVLLPAFPWEPRTATSPVPAPGGPALPSPARGCPGGSRLRSLRPADGDDFLLLLPPDASRSPQ